MFNSLTKTDKIYKHLKTKIESRKKAKLFKYFTYFVHPLSFFFNFCFFFV